MPNALPFAAFSAFTAPRSQSRLRNGIAFTLPLTMFSFATSRLCCFALAIHDAFLLFNAATSLTPALSFTVLTLLRLHGLNALKRILET
jgi:hypothetical protein